MSGVEFREILKQHNLNINQFLDLRDDWNRLSAKEKYMLLKQEENSSRGRKSNI